MTHWPFTAGNRQEDPNRLSAGGALQMPEARGSLGQEPEATPCPEYTPGAWHSAGAVTDSPHVLGASGGPVTHTGRGTDTQGCG